MHGRVRTLKAKNAVGFYIRRSLCKTNEFSMLYAKL